VGLCIPEYGNTYQGLSYGDGGGGGGSGTAVPGSRVEGTGKLSEKLIFRIKNYFLRSKKKFKFLSRIWGNSINDCKVFEVRNSCQGWSLWLLFPGTKIVPTPLAHVRVEKSMNCLWKKKNLNERIDCKYVDINNRTIIKGTEKKHDVYRLDINASEYEKERSVTIMTTNRGVTNMLTNRARVLWCYSRTVATSTHGTMLMD